MYTENGLEIDAGKTRVGLICVNNNIPPVKRFIHFAEIRRRRGAVIILTAVAILTLTASTVLVLVRFSLNEYRAASQLAQKEKALQLAQSGIETGILFLTKISVDQLYEFGLFSMTPTVPLGGGVISLTFKEETGKYNVNYLVRMFADANGQDSADERQLEYFKRLSISMGLPADIWDVVVDYIDENNVPMPKGAERDDYARLIPPRRIKNGRMQSIEELLFIPGFDYKMLYEDVRLSWRIKETSTSSLTDLEKAIINPDDQILVNNLTVYLPYSAASSNLININSAPYHVIVALSEFMTPVAAKKIMMARAKKMGRLKGMQDLMTIPELQINTTGTIKLIDEIKDRITFNDQLYTIVAEASIDTQSAQVMGVLDPLARRLVFYTE